MFISSEKDLIQEDPNSIEGSLSEPFADLENGILKGLELVAPFREGAVTVYLMRGEHFLVWGNKEYQPLAKENTFDVELTIK